MKSNSKNKTTTTSQTDALGLPLDDYEKEIELLLEKGNIQTVDNFKEERRELEEAAKRYFELRESKSITLRVNKKDLILVKARAKRKNIPYQTLINLLINSYAEGKTRLSV